MKYLAEQFVFPMTVEETPIPFEVEFPVAAFTMQSWYRHNPKGKIKWRFDEQGRCVDTMTYQSPIIQKVNRPRQILMGSIY